MPRPAPPSLPLLSPLCPRAPLLPRTLAGSARHDALLAATLPLTRRPHRAAGPLSLHEAWSKRAALKASLREAKQGFKAQAALTARLVSEEVELSEHLEDLVAQVKEAKARLGEK